MVPPDGRQSRLAHQARQVPPRNELANQIVSLNWIFSDVHAADDQGMNVLCQDSAFALEPSRITHSKHLLDRPNTTGLAIINQPHGPEPARAQLRQNFCRWGRRSGCRGWGVCGCGGRNCQWGSRCRRCRGEGRNQLMEWVF
jgi:hypothetical protein